MANNAKKYDFKSLQGTKIKKEGNYTIPMDYASLMVNIAQYLELNKEQYISNQELRVIFNVKDPLLIRNLIKSLRQDGNPIIASKQGYCWTFQQDKLDKYIEDRYKEIRAECKILNKMWE